MLRLSRIWARWNRTNASLLAAAIAFYSMLSLFPALATLISAYGLIAAPQSIARQLALARGVLPAEAINLLDAQITRLLDKNNSTLGFGFVAGLILTLWSGRSAAMAVISALNQLYGKAERRGMIRLELVALSLSVSGIMTMLTAMTVIALIPAILALVSFGTATERLLANARWPAIACIVLSTFSMIYRFAPSRRHVSWRHILPGAAAATLLWISSSVGFSFYVSRIGSYDQIYGSLGAMIVLLIWLYVSAIALLIGAGIDAELERDGPPD